MLLLSKKARKGIKYQEYQKQKEPTSRKQNKTKIFSDFSENSEPVIQQ